MELSAAHRAPSAWVRLPISRVCSRFTSGGTPSRKRAEFYENGTIPWVKTKELHDRFIAETEENITAEAIEQSSAKLLPDQTILMAMYGATVGQLGRLRIPMACNQACAAMIVDPKMATSNYVYYQLLAHRDQITSLATGAAQQNLSGTQIKSFVLPFPPLEEQSSIGGILRALDHKIELNQRMNETLEAMAQAIFKDWFVDFGPTRAKAEGRAPYLAPELWGLFPDALDDEGKPVGWYTYTLNDLSQHHRATVSPSAESTRMFEHYSFPAYDAGNEPTLSPGALIKSNKTVVPEGAVLLSKLNPETERVWLPNPKEEAPQVASTEFLAFTPVAPATRSILFYAFKSEAFRAKMVAMVTGTSKSHQRVSPRALLTCEILVAEPLLLGAFNQTVLPLIDRLLANRREARALAQTRDLLLPKLMSGEIRPAEAEKGLEAVA